MGGRVSSLTGVPAERMCVCDFEEPGGHGGKVAVDDGRWGKKKLLRCVRFSSRELKEPVFVPPPLLPLLTAIELFHAPMQSRANEGRSSTLPQPILLVRRRRWVSRREHEEDQVEWTKNQICTLLVQKDVHYLYRS